MPNEHNLRNFPKGTSGNPAGRPKGALGRNRVARLLLQLETETLNELTGKIEWLSNESLITIAIIKKAICGDTPAYVAIMDSAYGKPRQEQETVDRTTSPEIRITVVETGVPIANRETDVELERRVRITLAQLEADL